MRRVFLSLAFLGLLGVAFSLAAPQGASQPFFYSANV